MTRDRLTLSGGGSPGSAPDDGFDAEAVAEQAGIDVEAVEQVITAVRTLDHEGHPWRDPTTLRRLYYDEGLSQAEMADELGCAQRTVCRWMEYHGLEPGRAGGQLGGAGRRLMGMEPDELSANQ